MHMTRLISFFSLLFLISFPSFPQNFLSTSGKSIVNEMGDTIILRGMGLGNAILIILEFASVVLFSLVIYINYLANALPIGGVTTRQ